MPVKKHNKVAPKKKGKRGPKTIVPKHTAARKKSIEVFEAKRKEQPKKENPFNIFVAGVPRAYELPEQMIERLDGYFEYIKGEKEMRKTQVPANNRNGYIEIDEEVWIRQPEPPTVTGMCLFLGFSGRSALTKYKTEHTGFVDVIKWALACVAHGYEKNLHTRNCLGSMFALKNIAAEDWKDKTEVKTDMIHKVIEEIEYVVPNPPDDAPIDPRDTQNDITK